MITAFAARGYRSLYDVVVPLGRLTVVHGANGSGKSNLYRAIRLLAEAAHGRLAASVAAEGGLQALAWAGPRVLTDRMRRGEVDIEGQVPDGPKRVLLGFACDEGPGYALDLGVPGGRSGFALDPEVKVEALFAGPKCAGRAVLVERRGPVAHVRGDRGAWEALPVALASS